MLCDRTFHLLFLKETPSLKSKSHTMADFPHLQIIDLALPSKDKHRRCNFCPDQERSVHSNGYDNWSSRHYRIWYCYL